MYAYVTILASSEEFHPCEWPEISFPTRKFPEGRYPIETRAQNRIYVFVLLLLSDLNQN
jgi:hypothetical protein